MNFKKILNFLLFFIVSITTAQTIEINGTVSDSKTKQSIPGVNVIIKNSKKGVTTDFDGKYSIKINANEVLVFSSIGYTAQEIKASKSQTLNISLVEETNKLEEVVVNVGYGTQKKKLLTNAVSTIKSDAYDDRPITSVGQAIQGNAAGVQVVQQSGKPGGAIDIRIRGLNSINSGVSPIFVIDGVQTYSAEGINTDDIVDIQILKDATATAIYGVNGSSGVVLITTKRGKANKNVFSFSSYFGVSNIVKNIDVLNLEQYKDLMGDLSNTQWNRPAYAGINTNWRDLVFQTGEDKNIEFSYSGGSEKIKTFASLGYQDNKGIVRPSKYGRFSGRLNLDVDANNWLKAHANMNFIQSKFANSNDNTNANYGGVILSTLTTQPFLPVYADDLVGGAEANGQLPGQFASNPMASLENPVSFQSRQDDTNTDRYLANLGLDITLFKNLVWKPYSTIDMSRSKNEYFVDSYRSNYGRNNDNTDISTRGIGSQNIRNYLTWNLEQTLNYSIKTTDHELNFLLGSGVQRITYKEDQVSGRGFALDLRELDLNQMMVTTYARYIERKKNSVSYFGRTTYTYKNKYVINGVFRASGSSQLAPGHKWGYFPGISGAWVVSNENFLSNSKSISELKFRAGWGQTGNISGIPEYANYGLAKFDYNNPEALEPENYTNDDLTWETTTDINLGLDLGLFNNRIKLTADVFKRNTKNLLFDITIETKKYLYNEGEIENKGLELSLNTINFKGNDFNWNTNFNISFLKNKVLSVGENSKLAFGYQEVNKIEVGQPLGNFFGYEVAQVNPATGNIEYVDYNGGGDLNSTDRTIIGNALPDYTFGFTNNFTYKGFSLDALFTGSQGNDIFNATRVDLEGMQDGKNQSVAVINRWQQAGDITDVPKVADPNATLASSRFVEDGSYVRLKSVTLGYSFKKMILGLNSLKVYVTGQNLATWTDYSGFDPEVGSNNQSTGVARGIDYGTYPQVRTFIFGIKAGF